MQAWQDSLPLQTQEIIIRYGYRLEVQNGVAHAVTSTKRVVLGNVELLKTKPILDLNEEIKQKLR